MAQRYASRVFLRACRDTQVFSASNFYRVGAAIVVPLIGVATGVIQAVWWQIALGSVTGWAVLVILHLAYNWFCAPGRIQAETEAERDAARAELESIGNNDAKTEALNQLRHRFHLVKKIDECWRTTQRGMRNERKWAALELQVAPDTFVLVELEKLGEDFNVQNVRADAKKNGLV